MTLSAYSSVALTHRWKVRTARGDAWTHHQRLVERLTEALETAREQPGARPSATPMTASTSEPAKNLS